MAVFHRFKAGRFAEVPAAWIDQMDLNDSDALLTKIYYFFARRIVFISLFPLLCLSDFFVAWGAAVLNFTGMLFSSDATQNYYATQTKNYATLFSKSLLGLLFSPLGIVFPKLVSYFFSPDQQSMGQYSGGRLYQADAQLASPESVDELQSILRKAAIEGRQVMVKGAGLSQGKQYFPETKNGKQGILIDLDSLTDITIYKDEKYARVGAGVRWFALQQAANEKKLALKVSQASPIFSVGGSLGTNIHGWDHRSGNIGNVVKAMTIVNAQGEVEHLLPGQEKFKQILGGFGLFGIVVSVDLELTDNEILHEKAADVTIDHYVDYFFNTVQPDPQIRMHYFRLSLEPDNLLGNGVAVSYTKTADSQPVKTLNLHPEGKGGTRFERMMMNAARHFPWLRKAYWQGERARLLSNAAAPSTTNQIMQPAINAMFGNSLSEAEWLHEYFIPGPQLASFVKALAKLMMANQVALLNSSVRFVKQDHCSAFGYATQGDRFAVVICFNQALSPKAIVQTHKWIRESNDLAIQHGGSFYLPYQQFASAEQVQAAYGVEAIAALRAAKAIADPEQRFYSGLAAQYFSGKQVKPSNFKRLMASSALKASFAGFLENVLQRVETAAFYALLEDILKYNDSHEAIYAELQKRLPEIMPGALGSLGRILNSLAMIKQDLASQAKSLLPGVKQIDGLVEIGYPGRFIAGFQANFKVTGPIVAVYEAPALSDYVQAGFPRPYDRFVKLNYNAPDLSAIPDNSADLITCYIGLHHFPDNSLPKFMKDLRRILRPNGHFLLVDHNAETAEDLLMANLAHSVFNLVTGVSLEEEMTEIRNFQRLSNWQNLLFRHGLYSEKNTSSMPMVRAGDPSRNTMLSFVKPMPSNVCMPARLQNRNPDEDADAAENWAAARPQPLFGPAITEQGRAIPRQSSFSANC